MTAGELQLTEILTLLPDPAQLSYQLPGYREREGGYLSVSCALHCPGQTELAYSVSARAVWCSGVVRW